MRAIRHPLTWLLALAWALSTTPAHASAVTAVADRDLGTYSAGARFTTEIAVHNVSCKGKHDFDLSVEGVPWLEIVGPSRLNNIKRGRTKGTEVAVDLANLEPGRYRGRIRVRCVTCPPPPKCLQSLSAVTLTVAVQGAPGSGGSGSPGRGGGTDGLEPANEDNPFDSVGELHNALLDRIAEQRDQLTVGGVVPPVRIAQLIAETACQGLDAELGTQESCRHRALQTIAVTAMAAETPLPGLFETGSFSEEQREDVAEVRTAISVAFGADGDPQDGIDRIKRVEARILERARISALPREPLPCPDHWPPPCHWHCPLGPIGPCVPLPPVGPDAVERPIDQALLVASSVARHSIAYWHEELSGSSTLWRTTVRGEGGAPSLEDGTGYDEDALCWADFTGALWGAAGGFTNGLIIGALSGPGALGTAVGGALVGSVTGMVFSSAREAADQFGWF